MRGEGKVEWEREDEGERKGRTRGRGKVGRGGERKP